MAMYLCNAGTSNIDYDVSLNNLSYSGNNDIRYVNHFIQLDILSSTGEDRDWEIIVNYTNNQTDNSERAIIGINNNANTSYAAFEIYVNQENGVPYIYYRKIGDSSSHEYVLSNTPLDGKDITIKKANGTLSISCDGVILTSFTFNVLATFSDYGLMVGGYKSSSSWYNFKGTINLFKFRWLS